MFVVFAVDPACREVFGVWCRVVELLLVEMLMLMVELLLKLACRVFFES